MSEENERSKIPHKVLFINGPPRSGKDTAGAAIIRRFNWRQYQMKAPLWRALQGFFDIPDDVFRKLFTDPEMKEQRSRWLNDDTARSVQISLSEDWAKERYGQQVFGHLAVRSMSKASLVAGTVITDCGFDYEIEPIITKYGIDNCALMHLQREGTSFVGDSRSYIDPSKFFGIKYVRVINCYDKQMFEAQICRLIEKWTTGT